MKEGRSFPSIIPSEGQVVVRDGSPAGVFAPSTPRPRRGCASASQDGVQAKLQRSPFG